MRHFLVVLVSLVALADPAASQTTEASAYATLVETLERTVLAGNSAAYVALTAATADKDAAEAFARENLYPGVDRATVTPRFRVPIEDLPDDAGYVLTVDVFSESGTRVQDDLRIQNRLFADVTTSTDISTWKDTGPIADMCS